MLHWIQYVLMGLVVGVLARFVLPGADHMGLLMTILVGIGGSILGGYLGRMMGKPAPDTKFHPAGFWMSFLGAVVLLIVLRIVRQ